MTTDKNDGIFPRGQRAPAEYFTGTAWVAPLVPKDETGTFSIGNVEFEPGCRNNWHTHPKGQLLIVTDGNDNASGTSLERVVQRSLQSEVLIYAVGLLGEEQRHEATKAKRALKELTAATGGLAFYPKDASEVSGF